MRMVRVRGGGGGGGRPQRTRGGGGVGSGGGGENGLDWVVGVCVGAACMAEKRGENRPCFGRKSAGFRQQHTLRCLVWAVVTRQIRFRNTSLTLGNRLLYRRL